MKRIEIQCTRCKAWFVKTNQTGRNPKECPACTHNIHTEARMWALSHGLDVPDRGMIPKNILDSYQRDDTSLSPDARIDHLERLLKSRGTHISQQH